MTEKSGSGWATGLWIDRSLGSAILASVGLSLALIHLALLFYTPPAEPVLGWLVPFLASVGLVFVAYAARSGGLEEEFVRGLLTWTALGGAVVVGASLLTIVYQWSVGETMTDWYRMLLNGASGGSLVGAAFGFYQSSSGHREAMETVPLFSTPGSLKGYLSSSLIVATGAFLAAFHFLHLASDPPDGILLGVVMPLALSLTIVVVGVSILLSDIHGGHRVRILLWEFVGIAVMAGTGYLTVFYQQVHGVQMADPMMIVINDISGGGVVGLVLGYYDVKAVRAEGELKRELKEKEALYRLTYSTIEDEPIDSLVNETLELVGESLDVEGAAVYLDEGEEVFEGVGSLSRRAEVPGSVEGERVDGDLSEVEASLTGGRRRGVFGIFPMEVYGDRMGRLLLYADGGDLGEKESRLGETFARHLSLAIHDRRAEERVREQNEELKVLNRMVQHDIKNEMNLVMAWNEMAKAQLDGEVAEVCASTESSVNYVLDLIETSGKLLEAVEGDGVDTEAVDIGDELNEVVEKARASFQEAEFRADGIPDVAVRGTDALSCVFSNLVQNAVRHNDKEKPEVEVSAEELDGGVVVSVEDNGPGVPEDQKEEIFGRGEKGVESPGSGVGLYLVDSLVEGFGGETWVEDGEPEGAVFRVRLPKAGE